MRALQIDKDYFDNYAGRSKSYNKVWKDHSYYDQCCDLFTQKNAPRVKSLCVLGASTGLVLKEFHRRLGVLAYGCEINEWAYEQIERPYSKRIKCMDMQRYMDEVRKKEKSFDLIFANSFIYLAEEKLPALIKKISKSCRYLHFRSSFKEGYCPDPYRKTLKSYKWWDEMICENGFKNYLSGRARTYCWESKYCD